MIDPSSLRTGEQLIRVHHFRYVTAQGCALGSVAVLVEEVLGGGPPDTPRCVARPHHGQLVPKPEYAATGDTVEAALVACIERMRPRPLTELFFPSG